MNAYITANNYPYHPRKFHVTSGISFWILTGVGGDLCVPAEVATVWQ